METVSLDSQLVTAFQIFLSALLGALIGMQREHEHKPAGLRTYMLVSIGSTLFCIISRSAVDLYPNITSIDPTRIAAQILAGIGFIGAGAILKKDSQIEGVTTAAGLWVTAAIGMAVGFTLYIPAMITSLATWGVLVLLRGKRDSSK